MTDYTLTEAERDALARELLRAVLHDAEADFIERERATPWRNAMLQADVVARLIATHREQAARDALNEAATEIRQEKVSFGSGWDHYNEALDVAVELLTARAAVTQGGDEA